MVNDFQTTHENQADFSGDPQYKALYEVWKNYKARFESTGSIPIGDSTIEHNYNFNLDDPDMVLLDDEGFLHHIESDNRSSSAVRDLINETTTTNTDVCTTEPVLFPSDMNIGAFHTITTSSPTKLWGNSEVAQQASVQDDPITMQSPPSVFDTDRNESSAGADMASPSVKLTAPTAYSKEGEQSSNDKMQTSSSAAGESCVGRTLKDFLVSKTPDVRTIETKKRICAPFIAVTSSDEFQQQALKKKKLKDETEKRREIRKSAIMARKQMIDDNKAMKLLLKGTIKQKKKQNIEKKRKITTYVPNNSDDTD